MEIGDVVNLNFTTSPINFCGVTFWDLPCHFLTFSPYIVSPSETSYQLCPFFFKQFYQKAVLPLFVLICYLSTQFFYDFPGYGETEAGTSF